MTFGFTDTSAAAWVIGAVAQIAVVRPTSNNAVLSACADLRIDPDIRS
jgi:hypothetical protein